MDDTPKYDWFKFGIHFFCGAILGAFIGLRAWGKSGYAFSSSWMPGVCFICGGALIVGLIAGVISNSGWDE